MKAKSKKIVSFTSDVFQLEMFKKIPIYIYIRSRLEEEERDRHKLQTWMKKRQTSQRKKYLDELGDRRGTEHRPFTSQVIYL